MPDDPYDNTRIETGPGGLERIAVSAAEGEAHLYKHGAHVTHFQPRGENTVLWLSPATRFEPGHPIRGGAPICFPWFSEKTGDPAAPHHGLARLQEWDLLSIDTLDNGSVRVSLALDLEPFSLTHTVTVGRALVMRLDVYNSGKTPATFEAALHTYLSVGDVRQAHVTGLEGAPYLDKTDGHRRKTQPDEPLVFSGETDRVYVGHEAAVELHDPTLHRVITVDKTGSRTTVVWNPWIEKGQRLPDFPAHAWPQMLCIETGNTGGDAVTLATGRSHAMTAIISVAHG